MKITPDSVLMCPPAYYEIPAVENANMDVYDQPNQAKAWRQWMLIRNVYIKLGLKVHEMAPAPRMWDMIFTANGAWGKGTHALSEKKEFVLSNFRQPIRRAEKGYFKKALNNLGFDTFELPEGVFFEGQGDVVSFDQYVLFGYGVRSSFDAIEYVKRLSGTDKTFIPLELKGDSFYHLDTCLMPLLGTEQKTILFNGSAFTIESLNVLNRLDIRKLPISWELADNFVCNSVFVDDTILLNVAFDGYGEDSFELSEYAIPLGEVKNDPRIHDFEENCPWYLKLIETLESMDYRVIPVYTSEFKKSGAGVRCLTLFL